MTMDPVTGSVLDCRFSPGRPDGRLVLHLGNVRGMDERQELFTRMPGAQLTWDGEAIGPGELVSKLLVRSATVTVWPLPDRYCGSLKAEFRTG